MNFRYIDNIFENIITYKNFDIKKNLKFYILLKFNIYLMKCYE